MPAAFIIQAYSDGHESRASGDSIAFIILCCQRNEYTMCKIKIDKHFIAYTQVQ